MLISTQSGLLILSEIAELYTTYAEPYVNQSLGTNLGNIIYSLMTTFLFISVGGGITVIVGVIFIFFQLYRTGRILISLGAGMGAIGIIIYIIYRSIYLPSSSTWVDLILLTLEILLNLYIIGIILTIIGRSKIKKEVEVKKAEAKAEEDGDSNSNKKKKYCPLCKTPNLSESTFCKACGGILT